MRGVAGRPSTWLHGNLADRGRWQQRTPCGSLSRAAPRHAQTPGESSTVSITVCERPQCPTGRAGAALGEICSVAVNLAAAMLRLSDDPAIGGGQRARDRACIASEGEHGVCACASPDATAGRLARGRRPDPGIQCARPTGWPPRQVEARHRAGRPFGTYPTDGGSAGDGSGSDSPSLLTGQCQVRIRSPPRLRQFSPVVALEVRRAVSRES